MFRNAVKKISTVGDVVYQQAQRNIGVSAVVSNKAAANLDPIQGLFLDKIREYASKSVGGKLVDATPKTEALLKGMMDNLERGYGAKGEDFTKFPTLNFVEPTLQYPGISGEVKEKLEAAAKAALEKVQEAEAEPGMYDDWGGANDEWMATGWNKHMTK